MKTFYNRQSTQFSSHRRGARFVYLNENPKNEEDQDSSVVKKEESGEKKVVMQTTTTVDSVEALTAHAGGYNFFGQKPE
jgi:hypothetical protein